jgi:hypothetical protein
MPQRPATMTVQLVLRAGADSCRDESSDLPNPLRPREFLCLAKRFGMRATITGYPISDAPAALSNLEVGRFAGAAVLHN